MIKVAEADRAIVAAQEYARDRGYSISVTGQLCLSWSWHFKPARGLPIKGAGEVEGCHWSQWRADR